MDGLGAVTARVTGSTAIPGLLDASFDAFEVIRQAARACEDRVPVLFAAFMVAATTAVEGRNALNDAPSFPLVRKGSAPSSTVSPAADVGHVADELGELAAVLTRRLTDAATQAELAGDRDACERATRAAADIHQILSRGNDETAIR
jgi:hypothetical protein